MYDGEHTRVRAAQRRGAVAAASQLASTSAAAQRRGSSRCQHLGETRCTAKHAQRSVGAAAADDVFEAVANTSKNFDVLLQVFAEVLPWPRVGRAS